MCSSTTSTGAMLGSNTDVSKQLTTAALVSLLLSGCLLTDRLSADPSPTHDEGDAATLVEAFLTAVADESSPDRGWSLLHPVLRRDMFEGNRAIWLRAASAANWQQFAWSIDEVIADSPGLYLVYLDIRDREATPDVLTAPRNNLWLLTGIDPRERPHVGVRFDVDGQGIWGVGG